MSSSILTCFNGLDIQKYTDIILYQRRNDLENYYYWDEFMEYFDFNFYQSYNCWKLSEIDPDFYLRFPKYNNTNINKPKSSKSEIQNLDKLMKTDKKYWFTLNMPEIINFSNLPSLPDDLLVYIAHFSDLINIRLINKNIFRKILDIFIYKYIINLNNLKEKLKYLKILNIKPSHQASYIYYTSNINTKKTPCNAITKKGTFCKNLTMGNQKCHCHKSKLNTTMVTR